MDYKDLASELVDNPNMLDEIFEYNNIDLNELYDELDGMRFSSVVGDSEMNFNTTVEQLLDRIRQQINLDVQIEMEEEFPDGYSINEFGEIIRPGIEIPEGMTLEEYTQANLEAEQELEDFYKKNPTIDTRPTSEIPEWMTLEEYAEAMGEQDIDEIERREYIQELDKDTAVQQELIQSYSARIAEIEKRIRQLQDIEKEYGELETDEQDELDGLFSELYSLEEKMKEAKEHKKFYGVQWNKAVYGMDDVEAEQHFDEVTAWLEGGNITPTDIERVTNGVTIGEFKQATKTIKENAKEEQEISNGEISLDE